jgi:hypothetical protein
VKDCTREPGQFRNRITNETVTAMQWRKWNHYPISKWLGDNDDVCAYEFDKHGNMYVFTADGALLLQPMDWAIKTSTGVTPCTSRIFDQLCEEL